MSAAVLFDMDGTLLRLDIDIEEVRMRLAALFAPYGVTRPFRPIISRIGDAAREAVAAGGDEAALRRAGLELLSDWEVAAAADARPRSGARAVIDALAARGVRLGIVTDNGRACVEPALRAAGLDPARFAAIATRDDVPRPKPDPAGVVRAATALGHATVLWYIGDHRKDVDAGRAARSDLLPHLRVAALRGGMSPDDQLVAAGADLLLDNLDEALQLPGL